MSRPGPDGRPRRSPLKRFQLREASGAGGAGSSGRRSRRSPRRTDSTTRVNMKDEDFGAKQAAFSLRLWLCCFLLGTGRIPACDPRGASSRRAHGTCPPCPQGQHRRPSSVLAALHLLRERGSWGTRRRRPGASGQQTVGKPSAGRQRSILSHGKQSCWCASGVRSWGEQRGPRSVGSPPARGLLSPPRLLPFQPRRPRKARAPPAQT